MPVYYAKTTRYQEGAIFKSVDYVEKNAYTEDVSRPYYKHPVTDDGKWYITAMQEAAFLYADSNPHNPDRSNQDTAIETTTKVFASQGFVAVQLGAPAQVSIYIATSQLVKQTTVGQGLSYIPMARGFYIVTIGSKSCKVIVR